MRPNNIVTEAGIQTRFWHWWNNIPFLTSIIVFVCGAIYLVCLLVGYDSFGEICFSPYAVSSNFQVYRIYTSILFHASLLHVMFNMLTLVPLGCELERIMGSVRILFVILLLGASNAVLHILIAFVVSHNPVLAYPSLMNECSIGFSGVLFSMIVIETSLSGAQSRSVFGLFNVPANWYALILLILIQVLMPNVSLLGHLCGLLSGFAYVYGLLNFCIPAASFFSAIEGSSWLSSCVGRPKFILSSGGNSSAYIPTYSRQNMSPRSLLSSNTWRLLSSWFSRRDVPAQVTEDSRFPGRGMTLGSTRSQVVTAENNDSNLQTRLLDPSNLRDVPSSGERLPEQRPSTGDAVTSTLQHSTVSKEHIDQLVSMGFERTRAEVALSAADGNLDIAIETLMSHQ